MKKVIKIDRKTIDAMERIDEKTRLLLKTNGAGHAGIASARAEREAIARPAVNSMNPVIDEAQSRARCRKISATSVVDRVVEAERKLDRLGIPLKYRAGAKVTIGPGAERFPNAYDAAIGYTAAVLERMATGWRLLSVAREKTWPSRGVPGDHLALTEEQRAKAAAVFLAKAANF